VPDEAPPVPPDLQAALEAAVEAFRAQPDAARKLEFLLDALIMRGQLPERFRKLVKRMEADRNSKVRLAIYQDKYEMESPDIDCGARVHLCGARCCSFDVLLSEQDLKEGHIPWVIDKPYELPRDRVTRTCACMDAEGTCTIYTTRPGACRQYDCREDKRVWLDFDARIPAPMPAFLRED